MVSIEELNISDNEATKNQSSAALNSDSIENSSNAPETPEVPQPAAVTQEASVDQSVLEQERRQRADEVSQTCIQYWL